MNKRQIRKGDFCEVTAAINIHYSDIMILCDKENIISLKTCYPLRHFISRKNAVLYQMMG